MLTIAATVKAFQQPFDVIQMNALESWKRLHPDVEIIIFDDVPGASEACAALGLTHVPEVATSAEGTVVLPDLLERAQKMSRHATVAYINADIILMKDFAAAVSAVIRAKDRYLVVGRRTHLWVHERIDMEDPQWEATLRHRVLSEGEVDIPEAIDYFVFSEGLFDGIPPFTLGGHPGWDNWLIWHATKIGATVVNATPAVTAVHQRHDYSHAEARGGWEWTRFGDEAKRNEELVGNWARAYGVDDARYVLTPSLEITRARSRAYLDAKIRIGKRHLSNIIRGKRTALQ